MKDLEKKRSRKQDPNVTKRAGNGNVMGMMATVVTQTSIVTFQNGAGYARHAGYHCDIS